MNVYRYALMDEYVHFSNSISNVDGLIKPSKVRHIVKLNRYLTRTEGKKPSNKDYLFSLIKGRGNRTPWKCKGLPYIAKAKQIQCIDIRIRHILGL